MSEPAFRGFLHHAVLASRGGWQPIPVEGKKPAPSGWSSGPITPARIRQWADTWPDASVGVRCGDVVALDLDVDDEQLAEALTADAQMNLGPALVRYSKPGRLLLVYRAADGETIRKKRVAFDAPDGSEPALEVLGLGQQFVAFGLHPSTGEPYHWGRTELAPDHWPVAQLEAVTDTAVSEWLAGAVEIVQAFREWPVQTAQNYTEDERFLLNYRAPRTLEAMSPEERVNAEALERFDEWVFDVFPAGGLREYQGGYRIDSQALGRDLEEDLALHPLGIRDHGEERGYTAAQVAARWKFDGDQEAALAWLAERLGVDPEAQAQTAEKAEAERGDPTAAWVRKLEAATTGEALTRRAQAIAADSTLSDLDRERLVGVFQARYQELAGDRLAKSIVRNALARRRETTDTAMPAWAEGWYYVTHCDKLFRYARGQWVTPQGFNALYQRYLPPGEDGRRPSALRLALDDFEIPVADEAMYAPHLGERFTVGGRACVNSFTPGSIPPAAETLDEQDRAAVETMRDHLDLLCGRRPTVTAALRSWLAFQVQNPGRKIRWSPIIKGIEGDGKTTLLELLAACLGEANVSVVGPSVVTSPFNSYAEGSCVVGLEEVRMVGHNRHDAMNALKPLISNNTVDIHRKGQDARNAINVTNYLAFTNYADALPITAVDRRWFVVFTPWSSRTTMEEWLGGSSLGYFGRVHAALQNHAPALRRWLLEEPIDPAFDPDSHAPHTPEKTSMMAADVEDEEQALEQRLELGGPGVGARAIATDCLRDIPNGAQFDLEGLDNLPQGRTLARCLQKLGWTHYPKPIKWRGKTRRVWVKGLPLDDNDAVRDALDAGGSAAEDFG